MMNKYRLAGALEGRKEVSSLRLRMSLLAAGLTASLGDGQSIRKVPLAMRMFLK